MKAVIQVSIVSAILGYGVVLGCDYLESPFLLKYLRENLVGIILTLLAINTATLGFIGSKIQEAAASIPNLNLSEPIWQMRISLIEQFCLLILTIIALIIRDSAKLTFETKWFICDVTLTAAFIYSIDILRDTGVSVFTLIREMEKARKK